MKKPLLTLIIFFCGFQLAAQEICNNGIDDDFDGLIDLNDSDCNCSGYTVDTTIIPDPSFEEMVCCPTNGGMITCAAEWINASMNSPEYCNLCDFTGLVFTTIPATPLPGGGSGYVGAKVTSTSTEFVGICLDEPFVAGVPYAVTLFSSWGLGLSSTVVSLYGTPNCDELPWVGGLCPDGVDNWELLADQPITFEVEGEWKEITLEFTPLVDMNAIALGGFCTEMEMPHSYYYYDELQVVKDIDIEVGPFGSWCNEDLYLLGVPTEDGGTWQWYKEGIALIGETENELEIVDYGEGLYTAVYTMEEGCARLDYLIELPTYPVAGIDFEPEKCYLEGDGTDFEDASFVESGLIDQWDWNFGDGFTSSDENPTGHVYGDPGTYLVELVVTSNIGCKDSTSEEYTIYPTPNPAIEFIADGISSIDGGTGGCIYNPVQFNDFSTVDLPSTITGWSWDFGDGFTSLIENPEHTFDEPGEYTVTLIVETDFGCLDSTEIDLLMTDGLYSISSDTLICVNGSATVTATSSDGSPHEYIWSIPGADSGPVQTVEAADAPLMVYVSSVNEAGCVSSIDSIYIAVRDSLELTISIPDTLCIGEFSEITGTGSGGDGTYAYAWTENDILFGGDSPIVGINPIYSAHYCLTLTDGCESPAITLCDSIYVPPLTEFNADTTEGCVYSEIEFMNATNGSELMVSTWLIDGMTYVGDTVKHAFINPGIFDITLETVSSIGCESSMTKPAYIQIYPLPEPNFYASPNPTTIFNTTIDLINVNPELGSTFEWSMPEAEPSFSTEPDVQIAYPELSVDNYTVTLYEKSIYNCLDSVNLEIIVNKEHLLFAPNAFTPDGDSRNDTWRVYIDGIDVYDFHLIMFNRWGEIIWESYDPSASGGWDGHYGDKGLVENGVYIWQLTAKEITTDKAFQFEGTVTVLR